MELEEFDAQMAADLGTFIAAESSVTDNCVPACTEDFHLC